MENHPIPQDITGFQFKLIGSMTVKQFMYLAGGIVLGWFIFVSNIFFIIRAPLALLLIGGGVSFAFLPIEGRPMDTMILNLIKALFSPTQYVYQKTGGTLEIEGYKAAHAKSAPPTQMNSFTQPSPEVDNREQVFTQTVSSIYQSGPMAYPVKQNITINTPPLTAPQAPLEPKRVDEILAPIAQHKKTEQEEKKIEKQPEKKIKQDEVNSQRPDVAKFSKETPAPTTYLTQPVVKQVSAPIATSAGIPMTPEVPNLVTGIVRDPRGNPIPNILVEIKDNEENPVRAFKTNGLGHFASATPLSDGTYTIDFEDPRLENKFDKVSFETKGEIITPFEIISTDKREELRKELFN